MCWLCEQFGDPRYGDGLWYLNPRSYARNMYKLRSPGESYKGADAGLETGVMEHRGPTIADVMAAQENNDGAEVDRMLKEMRDLFMQGEGQPNQVVPLEEADKVLELCSPIGLIGCMCRKAVRAIDERNELEYTCMGMGVGMLKWERWPERYKGGVKFVNIDEAKEWNHEMDKRGFVHLLMTFGAPFIGGFCQCDYPDCGSLRGCIDWGLGTLKSHWVAEVDYDKCNGCGICASRCKFGALKFEVTSQKANIDQFKCYGCGLCQTGCPRDAIKLVDRASLPAVVGVW